MGKYLDIVKRVGTERGGRDISDQSDKSSPRNDGGANFGRFSCFGRTPQRFCKIDFDALERRCPDYIDPTRWQQAVEDGRRFLADWGEQAKQLGWKAQDLFGLAPIPECPAAAFQRLSRYDYTGLVWLLDGRPVVAMTEVTASIRASSGAITVYRRERN